jgi:hypothetical protein
MTQTASIRIDYTLGLQDFDGTLPRGGLIKRSFVGQRLGVATPKPWVRLPLAVMVARGFRSDDLDFEALSDAEVAAITLLHDVMCNGERIVHEMGPAEDAKLKESGPWFQTIADLLVFRAGLRDRIARDEVHDPARLQNLRAWPSVSSSAAIVERFVQLHPRSPIGFTD